MKNVIKWLHENRKNKRVKGLFKLGFWFLFFLIIFIFLNNGGPGKPVSEKEEKIEENELTNLLNTTSYQFEYTVDDISYKGKYFDNSLILENEECSFYIKEDEVLTNCENSLKPEYKYLFKDSLYNLLSNSELEATTSYKDGKIEYIYINNTFEKPITVKYQVVDKYITKVIINEENEYVITYSQINELEYIVDPSLYPYQINEVEE